MKMYVDVHRKLKNAKNCHTTIFDVLCKTKLHYSISGCLLFSSRFLAIEFKFIQFGIKEKLENSGLENCCIFLMFNIKCFYFFFFFFIIQLQ